MDVKNVVTGGECPPPSHEFERDGHFDPVCHLRIDGRDPQHDKETQDRRKSNQLLFHFLLLLLILDDRSCGLDSECGKVANSYTLNEKDSGNQRNNERGEPSMKIDDRQVAARMPAG